MKDSMGQNRPGSYDREIYLFYEGYFANCSGVQLPIKPADKKLRKKRKVDQYYVIGANGSSIILPIPNIVLNMGPLINDP